MYESWDSWQAEPTGNFGFNANKGKGGGYFGGGCGAIAKRPGAPMGKGGGLVLNKGGKMGAPNFQSGPCAMRPPPPMAPMGMLGGLAGGPLRPPALTLGPGALTLARPPALTLRPPAPTMLQPYGTEMSAPMALAAPMAPEVAAYAETPGAVMQEKKPKLFLLLTRLAPDADEGHLHQILEQCGEVKAWRRGRGPNGEPLSFGFAQFADPEVAWKASVCVNKRVICKQEVKVLVEEQAEAIIARWKEQQKAVLKVHTDEDLEWELERKSVSCNSLIDAKMEELYGAGQGGGSAQRRQELREMEQARVERAKKRKLWRAAEFAKELEVVESAEKRLRTEEVQRDDADRAKEKADREAREAAGEVVPKPNDGTGTGASEANASPFDNIALREMVDRVQSEPREALFGMELDTNFLRTERIFEDKLRPWLERKLDVYMGGPQNDLVEYVLRRVNAGSDPQSLMSDLNRYLDDNAEPLVERMWRMMVFELIRNGVAAGPKASSRENKGWGY